MLELLSPSGNKESFISAINAGANAVYLGLKDFSARKNAENFDEQNLKFISSYAKLFGVKVYVALNTLIKDGEIDNFFAAIERALSCGADAIIMQDAFLGKTVKSVFPKITLHLSTQAGICNEYGAEFAKNNGFDRVILSRETKAEDIKKISSIIETECFIQGALCSSFSGHCYFSSFVGQNSGNRGLCKQPCRKECSYYLGDKKLTGKYSLSLADLSLGEDINKLIDLGVTSFKIEGRMRRPEYVYAATKYYRNILDGILEKEDKREEIKAAFSDLKRSFNRNNYTKGLTFCQDEKFISDKVQGHIGEYIGKVTEKKGDIYKTDIVNASEKDGFKILRKGYEVGSAVFCSKTNFVYLKSTSDINVGDEVYITTDSKLNEKIRSEKRLYQVNLDIKAVENKPLKIAVETEKEKFIKNYDIVSPAKTSPLSVEDIKGVFNEVDKYPYSVKTNVETKNAFIPKSLLKSIRREIYDKIFNGDKEIKVEKNSLNFPKIKDINDIKNVSIYNTFSAPFMKEELNVLFPDDYNDLSYFSDNIDKNFYLYLPPYLSGKDILIIEKALPFFKGVYVDSYSSYYFAVSKNLPHIIGAELNVFNRFDLSFILNNSSPDCVVCSSELSSSEIKSISDKLTAFSDGFIPLMHLIYCPFKKTCDNCKYRSGVYLSDAEGRKFPVKRYKISECRFVIYNPYILKTDRKAATLKNYSLGVDINALPKTNGNYKKGVN